MCALLDEAAQYKQPTEPDQKRKKIFIVFALAVAAGFGAVHLYNQYMRDDPTKAIAVTVLVDPEPGMEGVLPHTIDSATEFEDSLDTLKEGAKAPDFRETDSQVAGEAVGLEATDTLVDQGVTLVQNAQSETDVEKPKSKVIASQAVASSDMNVEDESFDEPSEQVVEANPSFFEKLVGGESVSQPDPAYIQGKDWQGVVLVPDRALLSKAYSNDVSLRRVEAHPLSNQHLRVWARVKNETPRSLNAKVACNFRSTSEMTAVTRFIPVKIPRDQTVDVYFVSPMEQVKAYTVLVK